MEKAIEAELLVKYDYSDKDIKEFYGDLKTNLKAYTASN